MLPDSKVMCPATGFAKSCRSIVTEHTCPKFVGIKGTDPQTKALIDHFGCVDSFLPTLLINVANESRQTAAAVETFRNVVAKQNDAVRQKIELISFAREGGPRLVGSQG